MHPPGIHTKRGAGRTAAEKHDAAAAAHARERVLPSLDLTGALDHQVGTETAVEPRDFRHGDLHCAIYDAVRARARPPTSRRSAPRPATTTSRTPAAFSASMCRSRTAPRR